MTEVGRISAQLSLSSYELQYGKCPKIAFIEVFDKMTYANSEGAV